MQAGTSWLFVPAAATRPVPDADYLVYGAWLDKPDSQVGTSYAAAVGHGSDPFTAARIAALAGKATYTGTAAGFFAERHVASDTAVSGTFTATAELKADFGVIAAGGTTSTDPGTLAGTITDFRRSDDVAVDWLVDLESVTLDNATNAGGFKAGTTSGLASGVLWTGEWGVQLVGDAVPATLTTRHPTGVVGTFGAQHGAPTLLTDEPAPGELAADQGFVGVLGGFGARKQ